jgi:hypothetical protein
MKPVFSPGFSGQNLFQADWKCFNTVEALRVTNKTNSAFSPPLKSDIGSSPISIVLTGHWL